MAKQHIGVFGGTFDPIHEGHLRMALAALDSCGLDRLLVIPSGDPPYKACAASAEDRWRMVVSACSCDPRLVPSRLELDRAGSSYAVDTLLELKKLFPSAKLHYVVGADAVMRIRDWRRSSEVLSLCGFLVCPRSGVSDAAVFRDEIRKLEALGGKFRMISADPLPFSSTELRTAISEGLSDEGMNVAVREYCDCKGLYGAPVRLEHAAGWIDALFDSLKPHRFAHSLSVAAEAHRLALIHGIDPLRAEAAGILHDCAKCLPLKEMQRIAEEHALTSDPTILESGALLHSLAGAQLARDRFGMEDPEILDAVAYHNTGFPGMSRLAMCVCLADSIEPLRQSYPHLEQVRSLAETSLERALLLSLEGTADYVLSRGKYLHPRTQQTILWLRDLVSALPGRGESAQATTRTN